MEIALSSTPPQDAVVDLLILPVPEGNPPQLPAGLDPSIEAALLSAATAQQFQGKTGQLVATSTLGRLPATRVALLGAGSGADFRALIQLGADAIRLAGSSGARSLALLASRLPLAGEQAVEALGRGLLLGCYRFDRYLTGERRPRPAPALATLLLEDRLSPANEGVLRAALARGEHTAWAQCTVRDLVNEPAGVLTPRELAARAEALASAHGFRCEILDAAQCRQRGLGLLLAVGQGSAEPPCLVHLVWQPPEPRRRVALVGKGVTFDSGGLSLKTREGMLGMKADMAGAAAVMAATAVAAIERLPVEVHALMPCCENMPSGTAVRLNDVIRSLDGRTVEITNTDAEGRLILADALAFARTLAPDAIVDVATLTAACIVALGPHIAGVMSNNDPLCDEWMNASRAAGEEMWRLPLPPRLLEQLRSDVADLKNSGDRNGGALIAALFLREFVGEIPWVHADIAGPATSDKEQGATAKGATGVAVPTLIELLRRV